MICGSTHHGESCMLKQGHIEETQHVSESGKSWGEGGSDQSRDEHRARIEARRAVANPVISKPEGERDEPTAAVGQVRKGPSVGTPRHAQGNPHEQTPKER